jgi:hypothetical protein
LSGRSYFFRDFLPAILRAFPPRPFRTERAAFRVRFAALRPALRAFLAPLRPAVRAFLALLRPALRALRAAFRGRRDAAFFALAFFFFLGRLAGALLAGAGSGAGDGVNAGRGGGAEAGLPGMSGYGG